MTSPIRRWVFMRPLLGDRSDAKRTLTNLYNARPAWLADAHQQLDTAVATAYDWAVNLSEAEILACLLALNLARAAKGEATPGTNKKGSKMRPSREKSAEDLL